ncbi:hypothetical protein [Tenacibaculum sp. UWU-22]|uniref:hypothetical protein n=1 Tax=Tenacibaculum sp. UWU-22 TaxID=3234187 RepID=UPI0034DB7AA2
MKVFKEEQRFTQTWLIILIIISTIAPLIIIIKNYLNHKIDVLTSLTVVGIIIFATCFIFFFKLKTRIDEYGIHYQFFPFHLKFRTKKWHQINKAYIRKYDAITEYGGWGLKSSWPWNKKKGTAINISGDIGIQLELKNGKKLLIGTQKENNARQVLKTYQCKIQ